VYLPWIFSHVSIRKSNRKEVNPKSLIGLWPERSKKIMKNIPNQEEIKKGIMGFSFAGSGKKAFIAEVNGRYFTGYAIMATEDLMEIKTREDFAEALREAIEMNDMLEKGGEITPKLLNHG
jgi:hypothetical protein